MTRAERIALLNKLLGLGQDEEVLVFCLMSCEQAILDYLGEVGFAYRQDIARLLRIGPRQCWPILHRMLADRQITRDGQKYTLLKREA